MQIFIRVTASPELTSAILLSDIDFSNNKYWQVSSYIQPNTTVVYPLTSATLNSFEQGTMKGFIKRGLLSAVMFAQPLSFTNDDRPSAANFPPGTVVWNTDDNAPNYSDGEHWRDSLGELT